VTPEPFGPAADSPLTLAELEELEATLLPALERHHLRLLAHGLRTLQTIARSTVAPAAAAALQPAALPDRAAIDAWVRQQPPIADDAAFQAALVEQLMATGWQLERIAAELGWSPLTLELADLSAWATRQADRRLGQGDTRPS
jgi:hypothetical protein